VDGITFDVQEGELLGLLGPNGAGKTTTINVLTGLARPDGGTVRIGGLDCSRDPKGAQSLLGIVPDENNLYPELSGFENLCFCAALYGTRKGERQARARELLETFGLSEAAHRRFENYSKGMKRKLTFAAAIIHRPPVLFLDEPTTGLDVASARHIRQLIAALHRAGTTILLTTHYIEEAERLCDRIVFMVSGRIVRTDTVMNLLHPLGERHAMILGVSRPAANLAASLRRAFPDIEIDPISTSELRLESAAPIGVAPLVRFLESAGTEVTEARREHPSLEDVFVRITGIEAEIMRNEKDTREGRL
jgi:ABC-2 type transport system ATP-binding protein